MKVFCDLHQDDLYYSLWLLFCKRLGWELYRPIGFDWFKKGFWKYNLDMQVVEQYLRIHSEDKNLGDYYECPERKHGYNHKALTFDQFLKKDIDIIIASVNQHELPYHELTRLYKPKAKFIRQSGNIHDNIDTNICKNIMASTAPRDLENAEIVIFYHQEFELSTFKYEKAKNLNVITNLMNCLPDSRNYPVWLKYQKLLPEYKFNEYGILGKDGIIGTEQGVADANRDSTFIWHLKHQADGFGHVIHNAFACGRPPIVKASYYQGQLAELLMEDLVTCIDLDKRTDEENVKIIRKYSQPENYYLLAERAYKRFMEVVDYDQEFEEMKKFLIALV